MSCKKCNTNCTCDEYRIPYISYGTPGPKGSDGVSKSGGGIVYFAAPSNGILYSVSSTTVPQTLTAYTWTANNTIPMYRNGDIVRVSCSYGIIVHPSLGFRSYNNDVWVEIGGSPIYYRNGVQKERMIMSIDTVQIQMDIIRISATTVGVDYTASYIMGGQYIKSNGFYIPYNRMPTPLTITNMDNTPLQVKFMIDANENPVELCLNNIVIEAHKIIV